MYAAECGNAEVIKALLSAGADRTLTNKVSTPGDPTNIPTFYVSVCACTLLQHGFTASDLSKDSAINKLVNFYGTCSLECASFCYNPYALFLQQIPTCMSPCSHTLILSFCRPCAFRAHLWPIKAHG
jgi:hypothetical protein